MSQVKYQPYRRTSSTEKIEEKYKNEWFNYDAYSKDRINPKSYQAYNLDYNPLINKEPIWSQKTLKKWETPRINRIFKFSFLWSAVEQFYAEVKFVISDIAGSVLNQFKRKK